MDDFAIFILTHGRPDRQKTLATLKNYGWKGRTYLVIDDEDKTADQYRQTYGDMVLTFSKAEVAAHTDEGDNTGDRRVILYARNACFALAKQVGVRYFLQFDDDYTGFRYRFNSRLEYTTCVYARSTLTTAIAAMLDFLKATPFASIAMSQGGDHIGGQNNGYVDTIQMKRKAMNSFLCDVERPFKFVGRINEDVNTYVGEGLRGVLFGTLMQLALEQTQTQAGSGGMTDVYVANGTYRKSFYTIMYAPSCATIAAMGSPEADQDAHYRIHHRVDWERATPKILREGVRRVRGDALRGGGAPGTSHEPA